MSKTATAKPAPKASARSPARGNGTNAEQVTRLRVEVGRLDIEVHNIKENMATKSDIAELRADMAEQRSELKQDIAELRAEMQKLRADMHQRFNEMQRWIIGTVLSTAGFLSVLIALIGVLLQIYS